LLSVSPLDDKMDDAMLWYLVVVHCTAQMKMEE